MTISDPDNRYEAIDYNDNDRRQHRRRRQAERGRYRAKPLSIAAPTPVDVTDFNDNMADFIPSYAAALDPLHHERHWLIRSVGPFYQRGLLTDVTHVVKGGKEANVYCCLGDPATGHRLLAAKLYRPRMLRHLKNDAVYKAGRMLRGEEGKLLKGRRVKLALRKKTTFGKKLDIDWWIGNEFRMQRTLFAAGADVPEPLDHAGNAILMAFIGDGPLAAPLLHDVTLDRSEAERLFARVMDNIRLMLDLHVVHGDLSAFNILYWAGELTIIDFPQMVEARVNPHAGELLARDIQRVVDYFAAQGVAADARALARELWFDYKGEHLVF